MNADDCRRILENIEVIQHVANGGEVQFALHDYAGAFVRWERPKTNVLVRCLGNYRMVKRRVRVCCCGQVHACCRGCA